MVVAYVVYKKPLENTASIEYANQLILIKDVLAKQLTNLCLFAWTIFLKFSQLLIFIQFPNFRNNY